MKSHRIVFASLFAVLVMAVVAYGVPSFTPTIDGIKDAGWGATPDHSTSTDSLPTEFNLGGGCYLTDDSANVYIGIPTDNDPWAGNFVCMHVLLDASNTASGGTTDPYQAQYVRYDMPYLPDFEIITEWSDAQQTPIGYTNKAVWSGSSWSMTRYDDTPGDPGNIEGGGNMFTEIKLSRSEFGFVAQGDTINISVWLRPEHYFGGGKPNANSCLPADTFPTNYGDATSNHYFSTQFVYIIQTVLVDTTKPQVVSATQAGPDKVIIDFNETMDQTTLVFGNFTIDGGLNFTASQVLSGTSVLLTANANFVVGPLYTVTANSNVKDVAGNPIDPANNSASFIAVPYALMTFVYVDQNQDLTDLYCKGSFDNYGNYDQNWSVTPFQMYDDGTNGSDTTAGDDRWTTQFYLKVSLTDTFGWGANEGLYGDWAMDCGDIKFQVLNANPGQVQIYTVPLYAQVTFRIDDSQAGTLAGLQCWVKGSFNSIGRYEGAWGDYHQAFDDGFHNDLAPNDSIWGVEINLVPDDYCHDSTWEWGAADAYNGNWLIDGSNPKFAVPTSAPRIETYVIIPKTSQAVTVTFNVDMQYLLAIPMNVDSMALAGDFNGWDADSMIMSDLDNDSVYTVDVLFDSGSVKYHEFKFVRWDVGAPDWESINNRIFNIDDSSPTQTIDCIWNDWIPVPNPPDSLTISLYDAEVDGGFLRGIMLRWTAPEEGPVEPTGYYIYRDTTGTAQPSGNPVAAIPAGSATLMWKSPNDPTPVCESQVYDGRAVSSQPFPPWPTHTVTFTTPPPLASLTVNRGDAICFDNQGSNSITGVLIVGTSPFECGNTDFSLPAGPPYAQVCWRTDPNLTVPFNCTYRIDYNGVTGGQLTITVQ